jgi:hypothetical protein
MESVWGAVALIAGRAPDAAGVVPYFQTKRYKKLRNPRELLPCRNLQCNHEPFFANNAIVLVETQ